MNPQIALNKMLAAGRIADAATHNALAFLLSTRGDYSPERMAKLAELDRIADMARECFEHDMKEYQKACDERAARLAKLLED